MKKSQHPDRKGGGVNPYGQPDRKKTVFFLDDFPKQNKNRSELAFLSSSEHKDILKDQVYDGLMTVQYEVMTEQYKVMTGSHRSTGFASSRLDLLKDIVCHLRCVAIDEIRFIRLKLHLRGKKLPTPYLRYIHSYVIFILWGKVSMISSSLQYTIGIQ